MYDKEYADIWIKHSSSGYSRFREAYLYPFMEKALAGVKGRVLDIGCGWGAALDSLRAGTDYTGVDPTKEFFDYVKSKYKDRKITLKEGKLPEEIPVEDNSFDLVIASLVLHCVEDVEESIKTIFSKAKEGGKVVIVDFQDEAEERHVRPSFLEIEKDEGNHITGLYELSDIAKPRVEIWFHKEKEIEGILNRFGSFEKTYLGSIFVGYECVKTQTLNNI